MPGERVSLRDLDQVSFASRNTFYSGNIIVIPRSSGGFTYGLVMVQPWGYVPLIQSTHAQTHRHTQTHTHARAQTQWNCSSWTHAFKVEGQQKIRCPFHDADRYVCFQYPNAIKLCPWCRMVLTAVINAVFFLRPFFFDVFILLTWCRNTT